MGHGRSKGQQQNVEEGSPGRIPGESTLLCAATKIVKRIAQHRKRVQKKSNRVVINHAKLVVIGLVVTFIHGVLQNRKSQIQRPRDAVYLLQGMLLKKCAPTLNTE